MKYLLSLMVLLVGLNCMGQQDVTSYRYVSSKDSFEIKYVYNTSFYMEPSVCRMICDSGGINCREDTAAYRLSRHYFSTISVYKITKDGKILIGSPFSGYYVQEGCFEDVPEEEVNQANRLQDLIDKNNALRIKNGPNAVYKYKVTWTEYNTGHDSGGLTIKALHKKKTFLKNTEAHKFINGRLSTLWGGIDFKMDSTLKK